MQVCRDLLRPNLFCGKKSAVCIKAVTILPRTWLEGSSRRTNRSQWLSPAFNLGPVAGMANRGANCTYLCYWDTPVKWQGLGAVTSHGPPTDSQEGKAIYVQSSCCCPQQVVQLSKCLFQDKNSTWIPLAYDPYSAYRQVQSVFYAPPPSYLTWVHITLRWKRALQTLLSLFFASSHESMLSQLDVTRLCRFTAPLHSSHSPAQRSQRL